MASYQAHHGEIPLHGSTEGFELCDVCFNLQFSAQRAGQRLKNLGPNPKDMEFTTRYMKDFRTSCARGCQICDFIIKTVLYFELAPEDCQPIMIRMNDLGEVVLFCPLTSKTVQIYTPIGKPPVWEGIVNSDELSCSPDSQEAYRFIETCLAKCDQHSMCKPMSSYIPTRLIDVGSLQDPEVRLVETLPLSQDHYVALSYCWGMAKVVRTIAANYEAMKRGILVSGLPKTIQDAIKITRTLQQQYLWVDAICIIQDSISDWEIESSQMAFIYRGAYLTLAAGTSDSATTGFLHHRHLAADQKPAFGMEWKSYSGQQTILGARVIPSFAGHTPDLDDDVLPLSIRGWTLQESKLSRRVITYSGEELWWSCLRGSACECKTLDKMREKQKEFCFRSLYSVSKPHEAYEDWHHTVAEYQSRALTNPQDKLPAISGIARVVQEVTNSQYIAGLWSENFISDLTWSSSGMRVEDSYTALPLSDYRAPTFSWASTEQPIVYETRGVWVSANSCTVIKTESEVPGRNSLGQVQSGYATLRGLIFKSTLRIRNSASYLGSNNTYYVVSCGDTELEVRADIALETFEAINHDGVIERSVRRSPLGSSKAQAESGTPVFLFYLGYRRLGSLPQRPHLSDAIRGYLLLGKSPVDINKYERLGFAWKDFKTNTKASNLLEPFECLEAVKDFSELTITII